MNGIHVFWNCHLSWSPRMLSVFSAQMSCSKAIFLTGRGGL
jgi:hypothetical protein